MSESAHATTVRLFLLGRFEVRAGERIVVDRAWPRLKAKALLKLLALQKGRCLHREQALDALWPELEPAAAANNLHKNLHYLRSAFAACGIADPPLLVAGELLVLSPSLRIDVDEFRDRAGVARAGSNDPALYERALAAYAGDLLPEDLYEDWAAPPREDLRALRLQLLGELGRLYEARGEAELAAERLRQLLESDPLDEEANRSLMRLYARAGSRHRALRQYQSCRDILQQELGVEPSAETEALHREIIEGRLRAPTRLPASAGAQRQGRRREPLPPIYGRERELELADGLYEASQRDRGQALFIGGVAGIGKTRFAQQVVAAAEDQGARVLAGRSYELEATVAYQPLRDLLRQVVEQDAGEPIARVVHRALHLQRLLPGGGGDVPSAADPSLLQLELFNEITELFGALAAVGPPLVLWFDDVHASDEATLRVLHFLCRQLPNHPMLLIATYRTEEAAAHGGPLALLLASLRRERLAREIALEPLPERVMPLVIEPVFVGQPVERELLQAIARQAEGNPLFAIELAHTLIEEGAVRLTDGRWQQRHAGAAPVPRAIQDLLDRRLHRLDDAARRALQLASVLGRHFDDRLLQAAAQLPERAILDALDEGIAAFIIEEAPDGYRFRHGLLREGIYARLTRARRRQLHRAVATALASGPDGGGEPATDAVAYHLAASDEPWRAVPYLQTAAERAAAVFANEQAIGLYEQALTILRTHPRRAEPRQLASLLEDLGDLTQRAGDSARSAALFEEAMTLLAASGQTEEVVRVRGKATLSRLMQGDVQRAAAYVATTFRDVEELLPPKDRDFVVTKTYYLLAELHWQNARYREALEAAERALAAAEASDDVSQRARAYEVLALACHALGDWQKGIEYELNRQALGVPGFDTDYAFDAHL